MQLLLYPVPPREIGGIFKCIRKSVLKDSTGGDMSDVLYQVCTEGEDGCVSILFETTDRRAANRRAAEIGTDGGAIEVFISTIRYPLQDFCY